MIIFQIDMREVRSMKALGMVLALLVLLFCISSESFSNGASKGTRATGTGLTGERIIGPGAVSAAAPKLKSVDSSCRTVYKGEKPLAALLEDCVAYALDIPLAMLTPFVSLLTPAMDKLDYGCDTVYVRRLRK
jgi:hypothetical protein